MEDQLAKRLAIVNLSFALPATTVRIQRLGPIASILRFRSSRRLPSPMGLRKQFPNYLSMPSVPRQLCSPGSLGTSLRLRYLRHMGLSPRHRRHIHPIRPQPSPSPPQSERSESPIWQQRRRRLTLHHAKHHNRNRPPRVDPPRLPPLH